MRSKLIKILTYTFMIAVVASIVLLMNQSATESMVMTVFRYISFGLVFLVGSIVIYIYIFCIIDNKKIGALLNNDKYEELIAFCNKKLSKKRLLLKERNAYYEYLKILSYLELDDEPMILDLYSKFEHSDDYPATLYWRACYDFQKGKYDYIKEYYDMFNSSPLTKRKIFENQYTLFAVLLYYIDWNYEKVKQTYERVDESKISIPASLRALDIIKAKIDEITPIDIVDEPKEDKEEVPDSQE